jgi:hypothetical protein
MRNPRCGARGMERCDLHSRNGRSDHPLNGYSFGYAGRLRHDGQARLKSSGSLLRRPSVAEFARIRASRPEFWRIRLQRGDPPTKRPGSAKRYGPRKIAHPGVANKSNLLPVLIPWHCGRIIALRKTERKCKHRWKLRQGIGFRGWHLRELAHGLHPQSARGGLVASPKLLRGESLLPPIRPSRTKARGVADCESRLYPVPSLLL